MKTIHLLIAFMALLVASNTSAQLFEVDTNKSTVKWEGKKIGGAHDGHIKFKSGSFTLKDDQITEGSFVIDMNSMTNQDIESQEYKDKLIGHLKSDDFFGTEKYPTAKLIVTEASRFKDKAAKVKGNLTIKGNSNPIEFEIVKEGDSFKTVLTVDRAKYDIRYGSKSFFDSLGDKVIYDDFTLEVNVVTKQG